MTSVMGKVKEMVAVPGMLTGTFCTIMSIDEPESATVWKMRAAAPGLSGTPVMVILACEVSWLIPEMMGVSLLPSQRLRADSFTIHVASLVENDERT